MAVHRQDAGDLPRKLALLIEDSVAAERTAGEIDKANALHDVEQRHRRRFAAQEERWHRRQRLRSEMIEALSAALEESTRSRVRLARGVRFHQHVGLPLAGLIGGLAGTAVGAIIEASLQ